MKVDFEACFQAMCKENEFIWVVFLIINSQFSKIVFVFLVY